MYNLKNVKLSFKNVCLYFVVLLRFVLGMLKIKTWYHGVQSFYLIPILDDAVPACCE